MILRCPDCGGREDRPDDLCGMCSDPGVSESFCLCERYEKGNADCTCVEDCERCGTGLDEHGECWRCDDDYSVASGDHDVPAEGHSDEEAQGA